jgi:hypothetical protein
MKKNRRIKKFQGKFWLKKSKVWKKKRKKKFILQKLLKQDLNKEMEALRDLEREKFTFKVRHQELSSALELVHYSKKGI